MGIPSGRLNSAAAAAAATVLFAAAAANASDARYMNLRDLVSRADRIVRGTVVDSKEGTVHAGGGALPIVTYRIRVGETLKGGVAAGDTIEVRLLGKAKPVTSGPLRRMTPLSSVLSSRDLPQFVIGNDYLFVLTRPSSIGLSTTVGMGQGRFRLRGEPGAELALNQANNVGLFSGIASAPQSAGPVSYRELVKQIRSLTR
jgi:hypothetical protein